MAAIEHLQACVTTLRLIDTHEHLPDEGVRTGAVADPLQQFFLHYISADAGAAGLWPRELEAVRDVSRPLRERWAIVEPVWPFIRTTGYGRVLQYAMRDLYGIDDLSAETLPALAERMQAENTPGLYRRVLCERGGIDRCLRITVGHVPPAEPPLANVMSVDSFLHLATLEEVEALGEATDVSIHTLADLEAAVVRQLDRYRAECGIAGLKTGAAYWRPLSFPRRTTQEAEAALDLIFATPRRPIWSPDVHSAREMRPLQDHLMHRIVQWAEGVRLPLQIHTGFQEGFGNTITNSDPALLTNLLVEYPRIDFVLFHLSYPYTDVLSVMAKTFRNVYIDFCWNHAAQPSMARRALGELVDTIPANKLLGFGGDYAFVEGSYGHQLLARRNVAAALAAKVDEGFYTLADAEFLAGRILRENALELFRLNAGEWSEP